MSCPQQRPKRNRARHKARELVLQGLYQWHISEDSITQIESQFLSRNDMSKVDGPFFHDLLLGVARKVDELDRLFSPFLDRPLEQIDPVERAALRLGCYELTARHDIPYRIVINESIELTKRFGAQDSHKYINGILDKLAAQCRMEEVKA